MFQKIEQWLTEFLLSQKAEKYGPANNTHDSVQ